MQTFDAKNFCPKKPRSSPSQKYICAFFSSLFYLFSAPGVFAQVETDFSAGGALRIGDATDLCVNSIRGAIRFNDDNGDTLDYCTGSAWLTVLTSAIGEVVVNNGNSFGTPMIIGTNDANALAFETNNITQMIITASGNVGIGTTNPTSLLHVNKVGDSLANFVSSSLSGFGGNVVNISAGMDNLGSDPTLLNLTGTTGGAPRGKLLKAANGNYNFEINNVGESTGFSFNKITSGGYQHWLPDTTSYGETALQAIGIDSSSWFDGATPVAGNAINLNITNWGGSTPSYRHVYGVPVRIRANNPSASSTAFYADVAEGDENWAFYAASGNSYFSSNVGIGTTTPNTMLEVNGTISAANFTLSGTSSDNIGGFLQQRRHRLTVASDSIEQIGSWQDTEGAIQLMVAISSETSANSGTNTYMVQGGFSQYTADWQVVHPLVKGLGHGESTDGFELLVRRLGGTNLYAYELAVGIPSTGITKTIAVTINELKGGMSYNNLTTNAAITPYASTGDVFSSYGTTIGGNVGVGTTAPISPLNVSGGFSMTAGYKRTLTVQADHPTLQLKGGSDTNNSSFIGYDSQSSSEALHFWVGHGADDNGGTSSAKMSIKPSGNVGIGTTTPTEKLAIEGRILSGPKGVAGGDGGSILLAELAANGTNVTGFRAPDALGVDLLYELPGVAPTAGQVLSTDASGLLSWVNAPTPPAGSLDFTELANSMTVDATTSINMDTNAADLNFDANTLYVDSSANRIGIGTAAPQSTLHVEGDIRVAGNNLLFFNASHDRCTIDMWSNDGSHCIGTAAFENHYGPATSYNNTIIHKFHSYKDEIALQIGQTGGTGQQTNRNDVLVPNGNVGIGTSSPAEALDVVGNIQFTGVLIDASDRRLKKNIRPLTDPLSTITAVRGVSFVMKGDPNQKLEYGVIAQEVEEILPELVHTKGDEKQTKSVNYLGLISWLIEGLKELRDKVWLIEADQHSIVAELRIEVQKKDQEISELTRRQNELKKRLEKLEQLLSSKRQ